MYLKRLEMKGFKSFADKTEIDFESGVSCIVGPNGSGKSNITDAIRWVLGEQKVKTLRGSKMEDVIFNGTKHRKQVGLAEVSLVFDNSESFFPIDFQEVKVTRRVYRSGDSEYLINNSSCRLKELKELFMDTGLGTDGYSIIGQGKIDSILSTNKEERRQIFEEAAGIVKYKSRKKEAERKLEATNLNLLRVEDIIGELKDRVGPLKIESEKAKKFLEYSEELKKVEINVFLNNIDRVDSKLLKEIELEEKFKEEMESKSKMIIDLKASEREGNIKYEALNQMINTSKEKYFDTLNRIKALEGEESLLKEKISNFNESMTRLETEITTSEKELSKNNEELEYLLRDRDSLKLAFEQLSVDINQLVSEFEEKSKVLNEQESINEGLKSEIIDNLNKVEKFKSEIGSLERIRDSIINRISEIDNELLEISTFMESSKTLKEQVVAEVEELSQKTEDLSKERDEVVVRYKDILNDKNEIEKNNNQIKSSLVKINTEKNMLEEMEKSHEGFDYSVKTAMQYVEKSNFSGFYGAVASLMELPKEYEVAIDISLGKGMQNIVCDDSKLAHKVIDYLKKENKGRVTFLPLDSIKSYGRVDLHKAVKNEKGFLGFATDLISYDDKFSKIFEYLLGRTLIIETYDDAVRISKKYDTKCKLVTVDGEVINTSGAITGGSYKAKISNILGRKRKIADLAEEIIKFESVLAENSSKIENYVTELDKVEIRGKEIADKLDDIKTAISERNSKLTVIESELLGKESSYKKHNTDKERLLNEINISEEDIKKLEAKIQVLADRKSEIEAKLSNQSSGINDLIKETEELNNKLTSKKIEQASLKEKIENLDRESTRLENSIKVIKEAIAIKFNDLDNIKTLKKDSIDGLDAVMTELAHMFKSKDVLSQESEDQKAELNELKASIERVQAELVTASEELDDIKGRFMDIEIKKAKLETEKENIIANLWEKYEMGLIEARNLKEDIEIDNPVKIMNKLKKDIKDLGDVNVATIEEYEEVKERYEFLGTQHDDLLKAAKSLQKVIQGLETTMITRFKETLVEVRNNFNDIFCDLFNGGIADLIPEDESDILECNIEIVAQPPGKKLQSLNLLSGGEKALTAIALLFSILKIKPSPFCILDEIEAALDDVNVHRFAEFLRRFTERSQFVVITHRKGTMEIADALYGVTMEEFGVSKLVSVKLEDAVI